MKIERIFWKRSNWGNFPRSPKISSGIGGNLKWGNASFPQGGWTPLPILCYTHHCISFTNRKLKSLELLHEWWEKCKIAASSATVPVCNNNYVSRFPEEEFKPECLNLTEKHLLKIMIWCSMAHSEVGHCRWSCQCDQMHRYTADVLWNRDTSA